MIRVRPTATLERVLNKQATVRRVIPAPGHIEFLVKRKCGAFVCCVTDGAHWNEAWPQKKSIYSEDGSWRQEGSNKPNKSSKDENRGGEGNQDEHIVVWNVHHVCIVPDWVMAWISVGGNYDWMITHCGTKFLWHRINPQSHRLGQITLRKASTTWSLSID